MALRFRNDGSSDSKRGLFGLPAGLGFAVLGLSLAIPAGGCVLGVAVNAIFGSLVHVVPAVAYHDLRVAKEGVATAELARVFEYAGRFRRRPAFPTPGRRGARGRAQGRALCLRNDGGAEVRASSSPHTVPVPLSDPAAVDPEEAFVAALSSCHMLWFLSLAAKRGLVVDRHVDAAEGVLAPNAEGRLAITRVTLRPAVVFGGSRAPDAAELRELHERAHHECFLATSVRTEVVCEPVIG